ncbi:MAG TPA: shikimate dehydrogenase [Pirellulales bacterium]|jgi:shikimate dehydrogenase|nr:shikimate dehydrogenase [Pirellulales bacterium]
MQPSSTVQEVCALVGQPVAGNPTQFMIERAFAKCGLDWRYLSFEVAAEALGDAVRGMRAMGFRGGNITTPHKVAVIEFLDRLSPAAELIGAVNCFVREGSALVGESTDGKGFLESLHSVIDPAEKHVVLLGAGGAARAIGVELALAKAGKITLVNRTPERGEGLVEMLQQKTGVAAEFVPWQGEYGIPPEAQIVVQATSIGLNDPRARVPVSFAKVAPKTVVADVVFNPAETRFLQEAKRAKCVTLDGLGMIVNQGVIGFQLWTGIEPDRALMRDAVEEYLSL